MLLSGKVCRHLVGIKSVLQKDLENTRKITASVGVFLVPE